MTATGETHLPSRRRALIGREGELAELVRALAHHRMVTLTGTGGCGKTRLAVEAAFVARASFPDGVWFVDLADVADPDLVWSRVALALGLAPQAASNIEALTITFLTSRRLLLLLDNCEQILDAVATVADRILESAPSVTLLATTREPLDLVGEHVYPLAPLQPAGRRRGARRECRRSTLHDARRRGHCGPGPAGSARPVHRPDLSGGGRLAARARTGSSTGPQLRAR